MKAAVDGHVLQHQFPLSFNPLSWTPARKPVASKILFQIAISLKEKNKELSRVSEYKYASSEWPVITR